MTDVYEARVVDGDGNGNGGQWDTSDVEPIEADSAEQALDAVEAWVRDQAASLPEYDEATMITLFVYSEDAITYRRSITVGG